MTKKTIFIILALSLITLNLSASNLRSPKEEKEFAVPAFSDFFVLGGTRISIRPIMSDGEIGRQQSSHRRWLDINRDLQLNDFDFKQFEAIVEKLQGADLSGKELIARFRLQQEEKMELFALIYDLDRDGKFTPYDVDYFAELVGSLDESGALDSEAAVDGSELVKEFRERLFPEKELP